MAGRMIGGRVIGGRVLVMAALLATGGCTMARMQGFDALAATTDTVEVQGIGAGQGGGFRLSTGAQGRFTRHLVTASEWQTRFGRPLGGTTRMADASFTVAGPGIEGTLEGRCEGETVEYRDRARIGRGAAIETTETELPMRYACRFTRDGRAVGGMVLGEVAPHGLEAAGRRAGEVTLDGGRLELVSEHRSEAPAISGFATPLGYRFEDGGRATGMVSLNGPRRIALPRDPATRDAALAAGLALAFFWDPADL